MTTSERILKEYVQIKPQRLVGKRVESIHYDDYVDRIIIFTTEKCYVKLESITTQYGDSELEETKLTMDDLKSQLPASVWRKHLSEEADDYHERQVAADLERFRIAAAQVGIGTEAVEKLLLAELTN